MSRHEIEPFNADAIASDSDNTASGVMILAYYDVIWAGLLSLR